MRQDFDNFLTPVDIVAIAGKSCRGFTRLRVPLCSQRYIEVFTKDMSFSYGLKERIAKEN